METTERVFTDQRTQHHEAKVRASAALQFGCGECRWARLACVGPTGKPYVLRRLVIVSAGVVAWWAQPDRAGRVRWYHPGFGETYEVE